MIYALLRSLALKKRADPTPQLMVDPPMIGSHLLNGSSVRGRIINGVRKFQPGASPWERMIWSQWDS